MPGQETVNLFGIPVARLDLAALLESVRLAVRSPRGKPWTLAYVNAHSCNLFLDDPEYRRALPLADVIYVDGNGPRLAGWLAGERLPRRMTGADWIHDLCAVSQREGFRLYFLGSGPGVAAEAAQRLQAAYPELQIVGTQNGYFGPQDEADLLREIRSAQPDVLILGMSSPLQEVWMARVAPGLDVPVIWAAGGVLEYASGRVRRAPRWMRRLGLEWLGRWMIEPRRLTRRYLTGIPVFVWRSVQHAVLRGRARRAGG
jgi:N-acetylglucosaminyldiphosphoundecaprenol N-acetyl-beta-D-mannosaminyltransferase